MKERHAGVSTVDQPIYIAVTGTQHYYGAAFLKPGQDTAIVELTPGLEEVYIIKTTENVAFSPYRQEEPGKA